MSNRKLHFAKRLTRIAILVLANHPTTVTTPFAISSKERWVQTALNSSYYAPLYRPRPAYFNNHNLITCSDKSVHNTLNTYVTYRYLSV